eukprot:CFRG5904T1
MGFLYTVACLCTAFVHTYAVWICLHSSSSDQVLEARQAGALNFIIASLMMSAALVRCNTSQIWLSAAACLGETVSAFVILFTMIDMKQLSEDTMDNTLVSIQAYGEGEALTEEASSFLQVVLLFILADMHFFSILAGTCCGKRSVVEMKTTSKNKND